MTEIFRTFTVFILFYFFFVCLFVIKTTVQEPEQNQCHDIIRSSEMNMFSVNKSVQKTNCIKMVSH